MSPRHARPEGSSFADRIARILGRPMAYLREAFTDEDDDSFRLWVREQRQCIREGRRS